MQEMQETQVQFLGQKDPLEEEMATHSSIFAWRIPWMEEPGGLWSWVAESWTCLKQLSTHTHTHTRINHPHFLKGNQYSQRECQHSYDYFLGPGYEGPRIRKNSVGCHKLQRLIPTVIIPHFPSKLAIHFLGHRTCPYTLIPCWPLCRLRTYPGLSPSSENAQVQASTELKHTPNKQHAIFLGYNHTPCL